MNEQITDRGTQKRLHTKVHTMNIMRSGARPIKQSISRACCNHAFGIHESRHLLYLVRHANTVFWSAIDFEKDILV